MFRPVAVQEDLGASSELSQSTTSLFQQSFKSHDIETPKPKYACCYELPLSMWTRKLCCRGGRLSVWSNSLDAHVTALISESCYSRMAVGFYSLASLDLFGAVFSKTKEMDRKDWIEWIWAQYICTCRPSHPPRNHSHPIAPATNEGTGFRGGDSLDFTDAEVRTFSKTRRDNSPKTAVLTKTETSIVDPPNLIMTYAAILSLAILRDDFSRLDKTGLQKFVARCQNPDGR
jgi:hypothetical protein